jgi:hypothetical protein
MNEFVLLILRHFLKHFNDQGALIGDRNTSWTIFYSLSLSLAQLPNAIQGCLIIEACR